MSRMDDPMNQGGMEQTGGATEQVRGKAQQAAQDIREMSTAATEAAREQYDHLRQQATQYYDQGREQMQEWQSNLENYIHEQPLKSVLIAAGVGMILGVLWKRS